MTANAPELANGMAIIHSNQLENLRELLVSWLQHNPLAPLENETILVQSNGMAQWLKLALAAPEGLGICAAVDMQLPASFLWQAYRLVLGEEIAAESPFSKDALTWRIFKLLPPLLTDPNFAPLQQFLADDQDLRKRYALALCLADLFDQYQVYRADWLNQWTQGLNQITDSHEQAQALNPANLWQAELWRAVLKQIPAEQRNHSRAFMHGQFLAALENSAPSNLPRRIIVFGVSALPQQFIKALSALSQYCQVLICIHNPCQHYWADIIEQKDLLRAERRRQKPKQGMPQEIADHDLHLHANPLLAAWGKQGRDYIRLWDEFDEPEHYRDWFQRIDVFDDYGDDKQRSLLQQVQQAILDLTPLPSPEQSLAINPDQSLVFHIAHSPQREVEILHDQLLALFAQQTNLCPRDIIVMTPDIDSYAPHIRAVFGQCDRQDPRYMPFSIADQQVRGRNTLLIALEALLHLPEARFSVSELLDWLETPALRKRFNITEQDLPLLHQWIHGSGIRWGLHAQQRQSLNLPPELAQNTWRFGLQRLLLGYATGDAGAWNAIEPYPEIGGLSAALLGSLALLLDTLEDYWQQLQSPMTPTAWGQCLRALLQSFFSADDDTDTLTLTRLLETLETWEDTCLAAEITEDLPLSVVREAWLSALDQANLAQRFMVGSINFCTLMPMRAIPFQVICLLGMNDGDFPRSHPPLDFDLMSQPGNYRPGDRSRREDDRYLFLEALLSARQQLYISWIGRNIRDNSELPASVLVSQLRDYLKAGWHCPGQDLLASITTEHLLQPFSPGYFQEQSGLFTYAHEWRLAHDGEAQSNSSRQLPELAIDITLNLQTLADFLRSPVKCFFNQRLKVYFDNDNPISEDCEPFQLNGLDRFQLSNELLTNALSAPNGQAEDRLALTAEKQRRQGKLPMAGFAEAAQQTYLELVENALGNVQTLLTAWPDSLPTSQELHLAFTLSNQHKVVFEDWLGGLRRNGQGQLALILPRPNPVCQNQQPKWYTLLSPWLNHLAACANGLALQTFVVGADTSLSFPPIAQAQAYGLLQNIVDAWHEGLNQPLPLACKTGFAWLEKSTDDLEKAIAAAETSYTGSYNSIGEASADPYLARAYPDFASLYGETFCHYAQALYGPLRQSLQLHNG